MSPEIRVACPRMGELCPEECALYKLTEESAASSRSGAIVVAASKVRDAINNCELEAREREDHPEILN